MKRLIRLLPLLAILFFATGVGPYVGWFKGLVTLIPQCQDQIDNDGNSKVDWPADSGCDDENDNDESGGQSAMLFPLQGFEQLQKGEVEFDSFVAGDKLPKQGETPDATTGLSCYDYGEGNPNRCDTLFTTANDPTSPGSTPTVGVFTVDADPVIGAGPDSAVATMSWPRFNNVGTNASPEPRSSTICLDYSFKLLTPAVQNPNIKFGPFFTRGGGNNANLNHYFSAVAGDDCEDPIGGDCRIGTYAQFNTWDGSNNFDIGWQTIGADPWDGWQQMRFCTSLGGPGKRDGWARVWRNGVELDMGDEDEINLSLWHPIGYSSANAAISDAWFDSAWWAFTPRNNDIQYQFALDALRYYVTYQCRDGIDNDGDGKTDFDGLGTPANIDTGCASATDNAEGDVPSWTFTTPIVQLAPGATTSGMIGQGAITNPASSGTLLTSASVWEKHRDWNYADTCDDGEVGESGAFTNATIGTVQSDGTVTISGIANETGTCTYGRTTCNGYGCTYKTVVIEATESTVTAAACNNNLDDDNDGFTDFDGHGGTPDPGCRNDADTSEVNWVDNVPTGYNLVGTWNTTPTVGTGPNTVNVSAGARVATVTDTDAPGPDDLVTRVMFPDAIDDPNWYGGGSPATWIPWADWSPKHSRIHIVADVRWGDDSVPWSAGCTAANKLFYFDTVDGQTNHILMGPSIVGSPCYGGVGLVTANDSDPLHGNQPTISTSTVGLFNELQVGDQAMFSGLNYKYVHIIDKPTANLVVVQPFPGYAITDVGPVSSEIQSTPPDQPESFYWRFEPQGGTFRCSGGSNPGTFCRPGGNECSGGTCYDGGGEGTSSNYDFGSLNSVIDEWMRVEITLFDGQGDGSPVNGGGYAKGFLNGVANGEHTNVGFLDWDDAPGIRNFTVEPIFGGGIWKPLVTQYLYLDEIRAYANDPPSVTACSPPTCTLVNGVYTIAHTWTAAANYTFDATIVDPENNGLTVQWSKVSGCAGATFINAGVTDATLQGIPNANDTCVLQVRAKDNILPEAWRYSLVTLNVTAQEVTGCPAPVFQSAGGAFSDPVTSIELTPPAGIEDGDLLIAILYNEPYTVDPAPAGWTEISYQTNTTAGVGGFRKQLFRKYASSESGNYTFSAPGATWFGGQVFRISGAHPTDPITSGSVATGAGPGVTLGSMNTTADNSLLLMAVADFANSTTYTLPPGEGMTKQTTDVEEWMIATQAITTAGATGSRTATQNAAQPFLASLDAIKPVASCTPTPSLLVTPSIRTVDVDLATPSQPASVTYTVANDGTADGMVWLCGLAFGSPDDCTAGTNAPNATWASFSGGGDFGTLDQGQSDTITLNLPNAHTCEEGVYHGQVECYAGLADEPKRQFVDFQLNVTDSTQPPIVGQAFYVDSDGGSDGNNGTSINSPWRTIPGTRNQGDTAFRQVQWGEIATNNKVPCGSTIYLKGGTTHDTADSAGSVRITSAYYNECTAESPTTIKVATSSEWAGSVGNYTFDGSGVTPSGEAQQWAGSEPSYMPVTVNGVSILGRSDAQRIVWQDMPDNSAIQVAQDESGEVRDFLGEWWLVQRHVGRGIRVGRVRNGRISQVITDIGGRAGVASGISNDHYAIDFAFTDIDVRRAGYEDPGSFGESDGIFFTGKVPDGVQLGTHNNVVCIRCKVSKSGKRGVNIGSIDDAWAGDRNFSFRDLEVVENGDMCGWPPGGQGYCSTHWTGNHGAACTQESDCTGTQYFSEPKCRGTTGCSGAGFGGSGNNGTTYGVWARIVGFKAFRNSFEGIYQYGGGSWDLWHGSVYNTAVGYRVGSGGADYLYKIDAPKTWMHNTATQATELNSWKYGGGSGNPGTAEGSAQTPRIGDSCFRHSAAGSEADELGLDWCENMTDRYDSCSDPGVSGTYATPNAIHFPADNMTGNDCVLNWTAVNATTWASNNWTPAPGSSLIDTGRFLMKTASGGTGTEIPVIANGGSSDPRHYFFGQNSYLSPAAADTRIQIEGCGVRYVQSMTATTITVTESCTYANGAGVHIPWAGAAPDIGAVEKDLGVSYFIDDKPGTGTGTYEDPFGLADLPGGTSAGNGNCTHRGNLPVLKPNDTLYFRAGTYPIYTTAANNQPYCNEPRITAGGSGRADAPITIRNFPGETVTLQRAGKRDDDATVGAGTAALIGAYYQDYVHIKGLKIDYPLFTAAPGDEDYAAISTRDVFGRAAVKFFGCNGCKFMYNEVVMGDIPNGEQTGCNNHNNVFYQFGYGGEIAYNKFYGGRNLKPGADPGNCNAVVFYHTRRNNYHDNWQDTYAAGTYQKLDNGDNRMVRNLVTNGTVGWGSLRDSQAAYNSMFIFRSIYEDNVLEHGINLGQAGTEAIVRYNDASTLGSYMWSRPTEVSRVTATDNRFNLTGLVSDRSRQVTSSETYADGMAIAFSEYDRNCYIGDSANPNAGTSVPIWRFASPNDNIRWPAWTTTLGNEPNSTFVSSVGSCGGGTGSRVRTLVSTTARYGPANLGSVACNDGKDNDGDGRSDYPDDTSCGSASGTSEGTTPTNSAPTITSATAAGASVGTVFGTGTPVDLSVTATDGDGDTLKYSWWVLNSRYATNYDEVRYPDQGFGNGVSPGTNDCAIWVTGEEDGSWFEPDQATQNPAVHFDDTNGKCQGGTTENIGCTSDSQCSLGRTCNVQTGICNPNSIFCADSSVCTGGGSCLNTGNIGFNVPGTCKVRVVVWDGKYDQYGMPTIDTADVNVTINAP